MALRFIDSAGQHYVQSTSTNNPATYDIIRKWTSATCVVANDGSGRRGLPYLKAANGCMKTLSQTSNWYLGAAFRLAGGTEATLFLLNNNAISVAEMHLNPDFTVSAQVSGSNLVVSSLSVADASTWHYYEASFALSGSGTSHGTAVGSIMVDGVVWGTFSGVSPAQGTNYINSSFTANQVGFGGNCDMMDFYAFDNAGLDLQGNATTCTTNIGDIQIYALFPATDVTTNWAVQGGTGNANSCVSDLVVSSFGTFGAPNDDTNYVYSSNTTDKESFNYQTISTLTGTIYGAQYLICAKKTSEGLRSFAMTVGTATVSSENFFGTANFLSDYYVYYTAPLDSNNGTAWTVANFNTQSFGVTLIG